MTAMILSPVVWAVLGASVAMLLTMTAGAWAWASSAEVRRGVGNMARARPALGAALVASAIMVPPAILASLVVCCAGVMLLASSVMTGAMPVPQMPPRQVQAPPSVVLTVERPVVGQWFDLDGGRGAVEFRQVGGKLVSRYHRPAPTPT